MNTSTFTATFMPAWCDPKILAEQRVASNAEALGAPVVIYGLSDWFQMGRINTLRDSAQMVNVQPVRDWADRKLVGDSVGEIGTGARRVIKSPVRIGVACPKPTGFRLDYLRPELSREDRIELRHELTPYGATEPDVTSVAAPLILSNWKLAEMMLDEGVVSLPEVRERTNVSV